MEKKIHESLNINNQYLQRHVVYLHSYCLGDTWVQFQWSNFEQVQQLRLQFVFTD